MNGSTSTKGDIKTSWIPNNTNTHTNVNAFMGAMFNGVHGVSDPSLYSNNTSETPPNIRPRSTGRPTRFPCNTIPLTIGSTTTNCRIDVNVLTSTPSVRNRCTNPTVAAVPQIDDPNPYRPHGCVHGIHVSACCRERDHAPRSNKPKHSPCTKRDRIEGMLLVSDSRYWEAIANTTKFVPSNTTNQNNFHRTDVIDARRVAAPHTVLGIYRHRRGVFVH